MSIRGIGNGSLFPALWFRNRHNHSSGDATASPGSTLSTSLLSALPTASSNDQLAGSLAGSDDPTVADSELSLRIRLRTVVQTGSDGTVAERDSAKLQFHYELTTTDGQHVELNVKAKVQELSIQDSSGNSLTKTQVNFQFSLLLAGVQDGLSPLQSDQVPGDTQSGVTDGLQDFTNSIGDVLQQYVDGNSTSADDLVSKTVDTFNALVDAIQNLIAPSSGSQAPVALPTGDSVVGGGPALPAPTADGPDETSAPIVQPGAPTDTSANPTVPSADDSPAPDSTTLDENGVGTSTTPTDQVAPDVASTPAEESAAPPVNSPTPVGQLSTQVLQTVRFRFIESLTQIIHTLTPDERSTGSTANRSEWTDYQSSLSLHVHTVSLVDVSA